MTAWNSTFTLIQFSSWILINLFIAQILIRLYRLRCADNGNNEGQPIVTKPLIKNSDKKKAPAVKQQKQESDMKKSERGNCYTEPTQQRDNCVTSELYLIT